MGNRKGFLMNVVMVAETVGVEDIAAAAAAAGHYVAVVVVVAASGVILDC